MLMGANVTRLLLLALAAIVPAICGAVVVTEGVAVAQVGPLGSCSFGPDSVLSGTWKSDDVAGVFTFTQSANLVSGSLDVQGVVYQLSGSCPSPAHLIVQIQRPLDEALSDCQGFDDLKDRAWVLNLLETPDGQTLSGVLGQTVADSTGLECVISWKTRSVSLKRQRP
jgi:hypothetical protein